MDPTHFKLFVDGGKHVSIDVRHKDCVCQLICLNLRTAKTQALFETVFGESAFVHWPKLQGMQKYVRSSAFWIDVVCNLCDITVPCNVDTMAAAQAKPLQVLVRNLAKEGLGVDWPNAIRVFLLMNIEGVTVHAAHPPLRLFACAYQTRS